MVRKSRLIRRGVSSSHLLYSQIEPLLNLTLHSTYLLGLVEIYKDRDREIIEIRDLQN